MKQPKRSCPKCGGAVQVTKSVTMIKTAAGAEKFQRLKCQSCGLTGSAHQKDVVTWDDAGLAVASQSGQQVKRQ